MTVGRGIALALAGVLGAGCLFFDSRMIKSKGLGAQHAAESRAAQRLYPAPLRQPNAPAVASTRTLRVRVWADDSFRATSPRWRDRITVRFARANEFLRDALGVELEVEARPWERGGEAVEEIPALLHALALHDPGDDVDHVIGMTGGLARVTQLHEQLGGAATPGKHIVLRALTDVAEYQALKEAFPTLSRDELDELSLARGAHKEAAVLVHEWAHNLGAPHEPGSPELILSPAYHHLASRFSDEMLAFLARALAARQAGEPVAQGPDLGEALAAADTLAEVDAARARASDPTAWLAVGDAYARLGAYQRADQAYAAAGEPAREARAHAILMRRQRGVYGVPPEAEPEANRVVEEAHAAIRDGEKRAARRIIDGGLRRWPGLPGLLALRCYLELDAGKTRAAEKSCARAVAGGEEAIHARFLSGLVAARAGKREAAVAHLERTIELDPSMTAAWEALAELHRAAGDAAKLDALERAYRARFGRRLPENESPAQLR